ncbi:MAG: hypothetical protein MUD02_03515 [Bacteroidales bacterium]|jgi:hypothetical protein|nr:hypothetical protein [Bacteroidales bacterium]MCU0407996.1 hypothetical protein [Bacteroidales bacterium]
MKIINKLEKKSFGPFGSSTGFFMLIGGMIVLFFSLAWGIALVLTGAFAAFTYTATIIDAGRKRVKHADYIFGLFPAGRWIYIQNSMKLGLKKNRRGYLGYMRVTQPLSIEYEDVRVNLYDSSGKQLLPLMKYNSREEAENGLKTLQSLLGL